MSEKQSNKKQMLLVAFNMTNKSALSRIKGLWQKEEGDGYEGLGRNEEDTRSVTSDQLGGEIVLIDPFDLTKIVKRVNVRTPMGLHYDEKREVLLAGSDHHISCVAGDGIIETINNKLFNCIHWLSPTYDGNILVVSTGIDAILKIDLNKPSEIISSWFATENGYDKDPSGRVRVIDGSTIHQGIEYCTPQHTTHINSAVEFEPDKLLATLFHQGQLVKIDLGSGKTSVVSNGLKQPHGVKRASFGFMLADTNGARFLKVDSQLNLIGEVKGNFNWIQDVVELEGGDFVVADINNGRLVLISPCGETKDQVVYGANEKKVGSMLLITEKEAKRIFY